MKDRSNGAFSDSPGVIDSNSGLLNSFSECLVSGRQTMWRTKRHTDKAETDDDLKKAAVLMADTDIDS